MPRRHVDPAAQVINYFATAELAVAETVLSISEETVRARRSSKPAAVAPKPPTAPRAAKPRTAAPLPGPGPAPATVGE